MMRKIFALFLAAGLACSAPAFADLSYTQGSGTTIFDFTCFTTKHCPAFVPETSAGTELFTSSAPGFIKPTDGTNAATFKAGSTASVAGDTSMVVQINPNQPALANAQPGNFTQIGGVTVSTSNGASGTGTQRVNISNDNSAIANWGQGATGSAPPTGAVYLGGNASGATGGLLAGIKTCDSHAKYDASTSGSTRIITGVSGRKVYICGLLVQTGGTATNVKLVEGTKVTTDCDTSAANVTPAYQVAANASVGFSSAFWNGMATATAADDVCINASAANAVQADVWYTIQ